MSDRISCRLETAVSQALRHYVQDHEGETVSSVVNTALRAYLESPSGPVVPTSDVWEAIAAINRRLEALEALPMPVVRNTTRTERQPASRPPQTPESSIAAEGLLTDRDVAQILGRSKNGFQNSVRAAGLGEGGVYEGFRIVGIGSDPQRGGPARRLWEPVDG